ncbi:MAG: nucleotidyltransferase family protein [Chloroflexi bacterium]|nr:nucleotidyltransferase family protein [Chloroflexota bacterium]
MGDTSLSLFGSVARDEAGPESDVDLLVEFSAPVGLFRFVRLRNYLEQLLGRRVDLAMIEAIREPMREQVLRDAVHAA